MKPRLLFLILLTIIFSAQTRVWAENSVAVISGKWERGKPDKINLYELENSRLKEVASSSLNADGTFFFACKPLRENFYFIGVNPAIQDRYAIYLKPGDQVDITITGDSYRLNGDANSAENKEMEKWRHFIQPMEWKTVYFQRVQSTYKDFFPLLDEKSAALETYPKAATGNKTFDGLFETYKTIDFSYIALLYVMTPHAEQPKPADYPAYYRNLKIPDFTQTTALLNYPSGLELIERIYYVDLLSEGKEISNPTVYLLESPNIIKNDTIKGELVARYAAYQRTFAGMSEYTDKYGKYLITENQRFQVENMAKTLDWEEKKKNRTAGDFKFPDINGKEFALSDFKGKVVYIDVWATWCAPCRKEFPFQKKLEAEYRENKDMVFIGVSIDASKDKQKWADFLKKEKLPGIQLFAGDAAREVLQNPYDIQGIPRFILVGRDGKLIAPDAPRPSSTEIRTVLNSALKKIDPILPVTENLREEPKNKDAGQKSSLAAVVPFSQDGQSVILSIKLNNNARPLSFLLDTGADGMAIRNVKIPVRIEHNLIFVPSELSITETDQPVTGNFLFDTGANYNLIVFSDFVRERGLLQTRFKPESMGTTVSMGHSTPVYHGKAYAFKTGDIIRNNMPVSLQVSKWDGSSQSQGIDGSIGIQFWSAYNLIIDLSKKEIHLVSRK